MASMVRVRAGSSSSSSPAFGALANIVAVHAGGKDFVLHLFLGGAVLANVMFSRINHNKLAGIEVLDDCHHGSTFVFSFSHPTQGKASRAHEILGRRIAAYACNFSRRASR